MEKLGENGEQLRQLLSKIEQDTANECNGGQKRVRVEERNRETEKNTHEDREGEEL